MPNYMLTKEVRENLPDYYMDINDLPKQIGWQHNQLVAVRDQYAFIRCGKKFIVVARRFNEGPSSAPKNVWKCVLPNGGNFKQYSIKHLIKEITLNYLLEELINTAYNHTVFLPVRSNNKP